ncbi:MAG: ABC transporter ATP-binding protein [Bacteroidetes bacterium]|nr:MAG: ABC transporter ATP-binding protein [Bacteroidota bacterium]
MLHIHQLKRVYRTNLIETTALHHIDLTIRRGEFVSIMGPSGCGKSTLLNILGLIDAPTDGSYRFLEEEVATYGERKRAQLRKQHIGFVFQSFNLIDELTVSANIELPLVYARVPAGERQRRVDEALERMNMSHRKNHYPPQLSGGQQQRVAVARAIVNRPDLILADEPTGNLDTINGSDVMHTLKALHQDGTTIIMVTHSQSCAEYSDRILHMLDGKVLAETERGASLPSH